MNFRRRKEGVIFSAAAITPYGSERGGKALVGLELSILDDC